MTISRQAAKAAPLVLVLAAILRVYIWSESAAAPAECFARQPLTVTGELDELDQRDASRLVMNFRVTGLAAPASCPQLAGRRVRLSWYKPAQVLAVGQTVTASVHLRPPWGSKNPGGFDYRLWLLGKGYAATGYVRELEVTGPAAVPRYRFDFQRYVHGGLLAALTLGERAGVSTAQWQLFRNTGTIHLMVISGLHVGVFSGLVYLTSFTLLRLLPCRCQPLRPDRWAMLCGFAATAYYAWLAGAGPPVLRAAGMVGLSLLLLASLRSSGNILRALLLLACVTLLAAPRFALLQGFWLSYLAVMVLLLRFGFKHRRQTAVSALWHAQVALFVGLTPWVGYLTGQVPLVAMAANLLVVPLMSLLVIPLAMLGLMAQPFDSASHLLLTCADILLELALQVLHRLNFEPVPALVSFDLLRVSLAAAAACLLVLPLPRKLKLLAAFAWLPLVVPQQSHVPLGQFALTVLDVGQGSAAILDTRRHRLLIDAGVRIPGGFDAGRAIVLPAVRASGPNRLDYVLLSHLDNDHAGGVTAVRRRFPGVPVEGLAGACEADRHWRWDGVDFRLLSAVHGRSANDRSCTLLVSNGNSRIYLSGDISTRAEQQLLRHLPENLDVLVAPHHGSGGSSSPAFVEHLSPRLVVFSAARFNRYRHPRPEIVQRYCEQGAHTLTTGLTGAVRWTSWQPKRVRSERDGANAVDWRAPPCGSVRQ